MSRDFEFKQLLRAYRSGIINEAAFEQEVSRLEGGGTSSLNGGSFRAMGKDFPSERAAVMSFLESTATGEAGGAEAFTNWTAVCQTDCIRSGLRMVAEREAYHSRQLAQRLRELGGECKAAPMGGEGRKFIDFVSNPRNSDVEKLGYLNKTLGSADEIFKPVFAFIDSIKEDLQTREMLRLFIEDERSTLNWLSDCCAALSAPAQTAAA
ncbi:MAG TPA: hypothetical protein VKB84_26350 [Candidatus Binataceae bacterium]|nr:hypothetical protein [Candidatus Binataceae bacterium]